MYSARTYSRIGLAGHGVIMILGQSNAVGQGSMTSPETGMGTGLYMLGNDYVFRRAREPIDDYTNQVDAVSADTGDLSGFHSCWLRAARKVREQHGDKLLLVPCPKGSTLWRSATAGESWAPGADVFDRSTLFGSANHRRRAAGGTVLCVWYWGHETSTETNYGGVDYMASYKADMIQTFANIRAHFGNPDLPIVYAQLGANDTGAATAPTAWNDTTESWHRFSVAREYMRQVEAEVPNVIMVPTWDLPVGAAGVHVTRAGLDIAADRFARATDVLVYGLGGGWLPTPGAPDLDGPKTGITINCSHGLVAGFTDSEAQFKVWDGATLKTISSVSAAGNIITINLSSAVSGASAVVTYGQTKRNAQLTAHARSDTSGNPPIPAFSMTTV